MSKNNMWTNLDWNRSISQDLIFFNGFLQNNKPFLLYCFELWFLLILGLKFIELIHTNSLFSFFVAFLNSLYVLDRVKLDGGINHHKHLERASITKEIEIKLTSEFKDNFKKPSKCILSKILKQSRMTNQYFITHSHLSESLTFVIHKHVKYFK